MPITDPVAIRFVNEQLRPIAEKMRATKIELKQSFADWQQKIAAQVPSDAKEMLEDGREAEGVTRLSGADITAFVEVLTKYNTVGDEIGIDDVINKLCVRALEVK